MSQNDNGSGAALTAVSNGRPIKFTPERLEQIRNLVERGIKREEIAETIGVTLGSLQVTCSRLGISLRRSKLDLTTPTHHQNPLAIVTQLSHGHRTIELKLPQDLLGVLAIEAHFENQTLSDLISKLLTSALGSNGVAR